MELGKALDQIEEIHGHLSRTEVYRGYRSAPIAATGVLALLAGFLHSWVNPQQLPGLFVRYWVGMAAASVLLVGAEIAYHYAFRSAPRARRLTRKVLGQFFPALAAGGVVTFVLSTWREDAIPLLPGIWALLFGMGIFASRPYLPRTIGWVALFYGLAGGVLLWTAARSGVLDAGGMGATFGVGQFLAAIVLYWNLERTDDV